MLLSLPFEEIIARYQKGESQAQLANSFSVDRRTIRRRLVKADIPLRSGGEASKVQKNKAFTASTVVNELVDGMLLGDAWIEQGQDNARLGIEVTKKSEGWIEQISDILTAHEVKHSIGYRKPREKIINGIHTRSKESVMLRTSLYPNFAVQRLRWYPEGTKIVPRDLELTASSIAHWYWGDGSTSKYMVRLYTNNFLEKDCEFLVSCLLEFGVSFSISKSRKNPVLSLYNNSERERFLDLVRDHVPECFEYKVQKPVIVRRSKPTLF
ncbi:hypothetical protein LCGC14_0244150 [marine sediment metagenome]|uniref:Homing endonuclease LAGLIDADG domain-containing protein n=1 Tax=marine sediment metagenome TaxID=412755 RepID=A0A0F9XB20_9ZZZZ